MSRRSSLPGADELFRTTSPGTPPGTAPAGAPGSPGARQEPDGARGSAADDARSGAPDDLAPLAAAVAALDDLPSHGVRDLAATSHGEPATAHDAGDGSPRGSVVPVRHTGVRRRPRAVG